MRSLREHLTHYAGYHREPRNVVTHFVGIPMIMVAAEILLSRPVIASAGPVAVTPALLVGLASALFYLALDRRYGLVMTALVVGCWWTGAHLAALSTATWLGAGVGLFVVGWVFQFVGHWYEGKKPAFVDDIVGLVIGPLFVVAEVGFLLGMRRDVQGAIESEVGPLRPRVRGAVAG